MRQGRSAVRIASLLAAGTLALHKLRYLAGGDALAGHDHSYLPLAVAVVVALLALACAGFARELWHASRGRVATRSHPSLAALWLVASVAILSTFALQEWIEGWLAAGHGASLSHALAHIGWQGLLLSAGLGALAAGLLRGTHAAVNLIAQRHAPSRRPRPASGRGISLPSPAQPRLDVLATLGAGRAPPATSA
jgi:hypothetical protein